MKERSVPKMETSKGNLDGNANVNIPKRLTNENICLYTYESQGNVNRISYCIFFFL